jgi:hypothetical protein
VHQAFKSEAEANVRAGEGVADPQAYLSAPWRGPPRAPQAPRGLDKDNALDLSFESDGESVVDLTLESPVKHEPRYAPYLRAASDHARSASPLQDRLNQLAHEYRDYTEPSDHARPSHAEPHTFDATFPPPEEEPNIDPPLSEQQQDILTRCMSGDNIFFTGSAGTGKSVLLRALIRNLKARPTGGEVAITASTGMAAL